MKQTIDSGSIDHRQSTLPSQLRVPYGTMDTDSLFLVVFCCGPWLRRDGPSGNRTGEIDCQLADGSRNHRRLKYSLRREWQRAADRVPLRGGAQRVYERHHSHRFELQFKRSEFRQRLSTSLQGGKTRAGRLRSQSTRIGRLGARHLQMLVQARLDRAVILAFSGGYLDYRLAGTTLKQRYSDFTLVLFQTLAPSRGCVRLRIGNLPGNWPASTFASSGITELTIHL